MDDGLCVFLMACNHASIECNNDSTLDVLASTQR